jgi:hypothetical protein
VPNVHLRLLILFFAAYCLNACEKDKAPKTMSFYYWRTRFSLDSLEQNTVRDNDVHTLYLRYFDVDWPETDSAPMPITTLQFDTLPASFTIIPVILLRNRVFQKLDSGMIDSFVTRIAGLVSHISTSIHATPREIQFDCDWTETTKDTYFRFLRQYHAASNLLVSCTIRLHHVKYPDRTGIPPVDHGVLMFYNMGIIDAGTGNSIYDRNIAHRYTPSLRSYPLQLDLALPIFSWGLQVRNGKVIQLLDKMDAAAFEKDTNFVRNGSKGFAAKHAGFRGGYYFQENDAVKIESVSKDDLLEIVNEVNRHSNHRIRNVIFYDLDSQDLQRYDKSVFHEILDHID